MGNVVFVKSFLNIKNAISKREYFGTYKPILYL